MNVPQIRRDYISEKYVIIAVERGRRPIEFISKKRETSLSTNCPFCPGNESMIPGVIEEVKEGSKWASRVIWNKYKAVKNDGEKNLRTDNEFYTFSDAVGEHEVLVESPIHGKEFEDLSEEHIQGIIKLLIKRVKENYKKNNEYVTVFKNRGEDAGASLFHSHHQIISYNIMPIEIKDDIERVRKYKEKNHTCPYCKIICSEKDSDRRIAQDNNFVAFTPYASRFSFEAWILPKRCIHSITELNDDEIISLSKILKDILKTLDKLNYPPFNLFYKISNDKNRDYHFRIEIAPRLSKLAGFEYTTGTIINSMTPENAAKFYRNEE